MIRLHDNPLVVRYASHPAFQKLGPIEERFEGLDSLLRIDAELSALFAEPKEHSREELRSVFESRIIPERQKLLDLVGDSMHEKDAFLLAARESVRSLFEVLESEAVYRSRGKAFQAPKKSSEAHLKNASDLAERGFFHANLDQKLLEEFWQGILPWRQKLDAKRNTFPRGQASCALPLPQEGAYWRTFLKAIRQAGLLEAINCYSKFPLDLDYCALQLSHPAEDWWKNCYADVGVSTSSTSYMHYDQDYSLIKAIVYLKPVDNNGPFSLIPGSDRLAVSYSREAFFKRLDETLGKFDFGTGDGSAYYRRQFKSEEFRSEFAKIPSVLRGTSHFGDDVLDGTAQSAWLLRNEYTVTSDVANCTVFTGGRTVHRGGMVERGERWALQLGFRERDPSWRGLKTRMKRNLKSTLPGAFLRLARSFS